MNVNRGSSPSKKRKIDDADDGAARDDNNIINTENNNDGGGNIQLPPQQVESNIMLKLDRMEQMMMTLVGKQATVSSLESRCEQLEKKCSALENKLEARLDSMHNNLVNGCSKLDKIEKKLEGAQHYHEYNTMLLRNQNWNYSATVESENHHMIQGHSDDHAVHLVRTAKMLKDMTIKMRQGEFPHKRVMPSKGKGIYLRPLDYRISEHESSNVYQHWREFIAALEQFHPVVSLVPEDMESFFEWSNFRIDRSVMTLIKDALIGVPFKEMVFVHNIDVEYNNGGLNVNDILAVAESNKQLQHLDIRLNRIYNEHIERICSLVHNHSALKELSLSTTMAGDGVGNALLRALITRGGLKLRKLSMSYNNITSDVSTLLADFIASNPMLEELNLQNNKLNDNFALELAYALRTNTTLQCLELKGNIDITQEEGMFLLRCVLCDLSSLNSLADSNHCCHLPGLNEELSDLNKSRVMESNRAMKIYSKLSYKNKYGSNVEYFSYIDVKMLPDMLAAIQRYKKLSNKEFRFRGVGSLSIVYEVMRKWEKVFNLYELC